MIEHKNTLKHNSKSIIPRTVSDFITEILSIKKHEKPIQRRITFQELSQSWILLDKKLVHDTTILLLEFKDINILLLESTEEKNNAFIRIILEGLKYSEKTWVFLFYSHDRNLELELQPYSIGWEHNGWYEYSFIQGLSDRKQIRGYWKQIWDIIKNPNRLEQSLSKKKLVTLRTSILLEQIKNGLAQRDIQGITELFRQEGFQVDRNTVYPSPNTRTIPLGKLFFHINAITTLKLDKGLNILISPENISLYFNSKKIDEIVLKEKKKQAWKKLHGILAFFTGGELLTKETMDIYFGKDSLIYTLFKKAIIPKILQEPKVIHEFTMAFQLWKSHYRKLSDTNELTEELFLTHSYLFVIAMCLISSHTTTHSKQLDLMLKPASILFGWLYENNELVSIIRNAIKRATLFHETRSQDATHELVQGVFAGHEDVFSQLYQNLISSVTRHSLGEFYTPESLARLIVSKNYCLGEKLLDPACGSGVFLQVTIKEILKDIFKSRIEVEQALKRVYGIDVNPLALVITLANVILLLHHFFVNEGALLPNLYFGNSLFFDTNPLSMTLNENDTVYKLSELDFQWIQRENNDNPKKPIKCHLLIKYLNQFENKITELENNDWNEKRITKDDLVRFIFTLDNEKKEWLVTRLLHQKQILNLALSKVNIIVGNPPWMVLNTIRDSDYKLEIKKLAFTLGILPEPHQVAQLELSSLFVYKVKAFLSPEHGRIAFLVSHAFLTGNNHSRTRVFHEFKEITVWRFKELIFPIHGIVLILHYSPNEKTRIKRDLETLEVMVKDFHEENGTIKLIEEDIFNPYGVFKKAGKYYVKRFISSAEKMKLLPLGENPYYKQCYNGATLYPRNLVFINTQDTMKHNDLVRLTPKIKHAKRPWDFDPLNELGLEDVVVEKKFIHKVLKSKEVLPFTFINYNDVFLPIEPFYSTGGYRLTTDIASLGWQYFQKLDSLFKTRMKPNANIKCLWENLNYQNKLLAPRQRAPYKVVMMGSGQIVKAVLIRDENVIIDYTNFLLPFWDENEALFVLGFLNSPSLTSTIRLIKADRHIQKRPCEVYFPKYDEQNENHLALIRHVKKMESFARNIVNTCIREGVETTQKRLFLQKAIYQELGWDTAKMNVKNGSMFDELDQMIKRIVYKNEKRNKLA